MYASPLLIVQAMYSTSKGQSVSYSTWGGGVQFKFFLKVQSDIFASNPLQIYKNGMSE